MEEQGGNTGGGPRLCAVEWMYFKIRERFNLVFFFWKFAQAAVNNSNNNDNNKLLFVRP